MIVRTRSAGDILDATCTRCRVLTNHTIVAMVAGKVVRVKCNTCGSEHNYHAPKEASPPSPRRAGGDGTRVPSTQKKKEAPPPLFREQWEAAMAGRDATQARPYEMDGKYGRHDLVSHPVFGIGIVTMKAGNKMEALFKDGPKLLRCGK